MRISCVCPSVKPIAFAHARSHVLNRSFHAPAAIARAAASVCVAVTVALALIGCSDREPSSATTRPGATTRPAASSDALVVYCAHDRIYSEQILNAFTAETGIRVVAKYDSELTKSLALVELIRQEKSSPQCDVFWNNELLGTLDLMDDDLLEEHAREFKQSGAMWRDHKGRWFGFAGRFRVWIVNTDRLRPEWEAIDKAFNSADLSRFTEANPLFGTTRTHYTVLWSLLGGDTVKRLRGSWTERGRVLARSNGQTKSLVAEGACDFGWTDTDDFFEAKSDGKSVAMLPVRVEPEGLSLRDARYETAAGTADGKAYVAIPDEARVFRGSATICIPNTAAVIRGTKKADAARQLVDYLASPQTQIALARGPSRQVPLCELTPEQEASLPAEIAAMRAWVKDAMNPEIEARARRDCLSWLKSEAGR